MRITPLIPAVLALTLASATVAEAAKPPPKPPKVTPSVTLAATPSIVVFSAATTLSGRLTASVAKGVTIRLEQDSTAPLGDRFTFTGLTATTAANGTYSLAPKPARNTLYRVVAQTAPKATSATRLVRVRSRVGIMLSDSTPRTGTRVRFSGFVYPAHDGRTVSVQRRSSTGRFLTVTRSVLRDAGTTRSSYSMRARVRRTGVYRTKVTSDTDHLTGYSRLRTITVH